MSVVEVEEGGVGYSIHFRRFFHPQLKRDFWTVDVVRFTPRLAEFDPNSRAVCSDFDSESEAFSAEEKIVSDLVSLGLSGAAAKRLFRNATEKFMSDDVWTRISDFEKAKESAWSEFCESMKQS